MLNLKLHVVNIEIVQWPVTLRPVKVSHEMKANHRRRVQFLEMLHFKKVQIAIDIAMQYFSKLYSHSCD